MTAITEFQKFDEENVVSLLEQIGEQLNGGHGELVLDFSAVRRLNANSLRALEEFATKAESKSTKVVLRGVNVDLYKVLTLVKLTSRFAFVS